METLKNVVTVLQLLCSLGLIVVVMLQSGKEAGLSGALAGNSNSYLANTKKGSSLLARSTVYVGLAFAVLTLLLSIL